jgi:hypothetical protein
VNTRLYSSGIIHNGVLNALLCAGEGTGETTDGRRAIMSTRASTRDWDGLGHSNGQ